MAERKIYNMLGLAMKAGKLVSGALMTERAIKGGKAELVIVSADAADNTKKQFRNSCAYYGVPFYTYGAGEELGRALGKDVRTSLAVCDSGFAEAIEKIISNERGK